MAKIKSYTDLQQSKKLAEILPLETADMHHFIHEVDTVGFGYEKNAEEFYSKIKFEYIPCWSLAALLNILHSKVRDIPSLSGGGYKDGKYISDWCLDYEFENGDYQKTFADNPIDACVAMVEKLKELNLL